MDTTALALTPALAELAEAGRQEHTHLGVQVFASVHGETRIDAAHGEARPGVPMTPDSLNTWMSASKPLAAVALARLREAGRLHWDDPVARHLPDFAQGDKDAVTLRDLLTHSGGFRVAMGMTDGQSWQRTLELICAQRLEPRWTPGETVGYHPETSWYVLAEIIRRLDGRTYDRYLRDEIFEPLGMTDCWMGLPDDFESRYGDRVAWMMHRDEHGALHPNGWEHPPKATRLVPGANGRGPANQFARFYRMLLGGGQLDGVRLLRPETVDELLEVRFDGVLDKTFRKPMRWSLGLMRDAKRHTAQPAYGFGPHASPRTFGHGGRESTQAFADPAHGLVAAVFFNGMPGEPVHQARMNCFLGTLYEDLGLA